MAPSTYDSLTKTPYIFFGGCSIFLLDPKSQLNINGRNHHRGDHKGRPKKGQKTNSLQKQQKKKEES
jgi:hypothetical protein